MLNSGDVFAGFTIERMLGQGGMGSVYLARHPRLPRQTALKLLNRELFTDAEVRARFEREADLAAQLDHPNIVAVYDRGEEDEQLWISMQYVDGIDAATVQPHSLPPERAVQIVEGVAAALDYAHGMGVLHRDVKPANIMLARSDGGKRERVFLTDFGIARLREDSTHLTQTGMFTATLAYASPEQMTGAHLDSGSDQYSLACSLYWLLTGVGPFDANNPAEIIRGHLQLAPPPVATIRPGLNPALDLVLGRAMAKRPAERFGSCGEFAAAAKQALTAPPPPPGYGPAPTVVANPALSQPVPALAYPAAPTYANQGDAPYPGQVETPQGQSFAPQFTPVPAPPQYAPTLTPASQFAPTSAPQFAQSPEHGAAQGFSSPAYPPPPNYPPQGGFPATPPPKRSNTGLLVGIGAAVVVLLVLVVGVIVVANRGGGGDDSSPTAAGKPSGAAGPAGSSTDPQVLAKAFPQVLPQGVDTKYGIGNGDGYHGKKCFLETNDRNDTKLSANSDVPNFPKWAVGWDCWGTPINEPNMIAVAFKSADDAKAAVAGFPSNTRATETKNGKSVTTYRWQKSGSGFPEGFIAVSFENDPPRANYLFLAHVTITDTVASSGFGLTSSAWKSWWSNLPL
ncbi:serine/threonine-protein kinase [Nocardia arthritidis]|uniref:non-specific serine/threonine protein kinase n=1 Tax=Nocardia arthritidis TaxID=228602 RepID=A0A6G9YNV1_9NOCA|nr:serine/threonine-protein kinase [Nocardia arthritidis]QIS14757.1 protein kinase [Nocardia arthritidis]